MKTGGKENAWLNLGFNIAAPSLLLIWGKKSAQLCGVDTSAPDVDMWIFATALAFPLLYGVYDLVSRRKFNFISVIGIASVALTGGIGLLKISRGWMIVKEGAVPLAIGLAVLATTAAKKPLAEALLMNESVMDVEKINAALDLRGTRRTFDAALKSATVLVALSFVLSSVLNFALAYWIFRSDPGTEAFNAEVGRMTALSFPVIVLPCTLVMVWAVFRILKAVTLCTGLSMEDVAAGKVKK